MLAADPKSDPVSPSYRETAAFASRSEGEPLGHRRRKGVVGSLMATRVRQFAIAGVVDPAVWSSETAETWSFGGRRRNDAALYSNRTSSLGMRRI
jgi:hypothetical protein